VRAEVGGQLPGVDGGRTWCKQQSKEVPGRNLCSGNSKRGEGRGGSAQVRIFSRKDDAQGEDVQRMPARHSRHSEASREAVVCLVHLSVCLFVCLPLSSDSFAQPHTKLVNATEWVSPGPIGNLSPVQQAAASLGAGGHAGVRDSHSLSLGGGAQRSGRDDRILWDGPRDGLRDRGPQTSTLLYGNRCRLEMNVSSLNAHATGTH
jgi:hypothetical protein